MRVLYVYVGIIYVLCTFILSSCTLEAFGPHLYYYHVHLSICTYKHARTHIRMYTSAYVCIYTYVHVGF